MSKTRIEELDAELAWSKRERLALELAHELITGKLDSNQIAAWLEAKGAADAERIVRRAEEIRQETYQRFDEIEAAHPEMTSDQVEMEVALSLNAEARQKWHRQRLH